MYHSEKARLRFLPQTGFDASITMGKEMQAGLENKIRKTDFSGGKREGIYLGFSDSFFRYSAN